MPTLPLTPDELYALFASAGFPSNIVKFIPGGASVLETMVCIALRESAGIPDVHNKNAATGDDSYGLTQINMDSPDVNQYVYEHMAWEPGDDERLLDPITNAKVAFLLSRGGAAWAMKDLWFYRDGLAEAAAVHLPLAQAAAAKYAAQVKA